MAVLKTDSPLSSRIVRAFLDFLNSVEPAPGVDLEGLEVAKECLAEVFKVAPSSVDSRGTSDSLVSIFSLREASVQQEHKSDVSHETLLPNAPSTSSAENYRDTSCSEASQTLGEDLSREAQMLGVSKDELFGQFVGALEKSHYFKPTSDGLDDQIQLDRATHSFHGAVVEMQKTGCQMFDEKNLAETFKSQGNRAMQSKLYSDAIELYTFAVALCEDNAVYYCNRAAAYTQIQKYAEAIRDCHKSVEINPIYSKAYSRLGCVHYAQGNYKDAIDKGFMKALQLDPNNDSVKENIQAAERKLEELRRSAHDQNSSLASHQESSQQSAGGSTSHAVPPQFTSMPFNANGQFTSMPFNASGLPADFASMVMNMASNVSQGLQSEDRQEIASNTDASHDPEIRVGGNMSFNFGEQMPEDVAGALRSVMGMFSGASPVNQHENVNGGSAPG